MRNFKKFLALVLAMLMVVSAAATVSAFSDVAEDNQYAAAIADLVEKGIVNGVGDDKFNPDGAVERYQMALMMARALDPDKTNEEWAEGMSIFTDVTEWYGAINYAYMNGIVTGIGNLQFAPHAGIRYQDALIMALRALGYTVDVSGDPYWLAAYNQAAKIGLTKNVAVNKGDHELNRAETAQVIFNMLYTTPADGGLTIAAKNFGEATVANTTTFVITATPKQAYADSYKAAEDGYVGIQQLVNGLPTGDVVYVPAILLGIADEDVEDYFSYSVALVNYDAKTGKFDKAIMGNKPTVVYNADVSVPTGSKIVVNGVTYYTVEQITGAALKNEIVVFNGSAFAEAAKMLLTNKDGDIVNYSGTVVATFAYQTPTGAKYYVDQTSYNNKEVISEAVALERFGVKVADGSYTKYATLKASDLKANYQLVMFDDDNDGKFERAIVNKVYAAAFTPKNNDGETFGPMAATKGVTYTEDLTKGEVFTYTYNEQTKVVTVLGTYEAQTGTLTRINTTKNNNDGKNNVTLTIDGKDYVLGNTKREEAGLTGASIYNKANGAYDEVANGNLAYYYDTLGANGAAGLQIGTPIKFYAIGDTIITAKSYKIDEVFDYVVLKELTSYDSSAIYADIFVGGKLVEDAKISVINKKIVSELNVFQLSSLLANRDGILDSGNVFRAVKLADGSYQLSEQFTKTPDSMTAFKLTTRDFRGKTLNFDDGIADAGFTDRNNFLRTNDNTVFYFINEKDNGIAAISTYVGAADKSSIDTSKGSVEIYANKIGYGSSDFNGVASIVIVYYTDASAIKGFGVANVEYNTVYLFGDGSKVASYNSASAAELGLTGSEYAGKYFYQYSVTGINMANGSKITTVYSENDLTNGQFVTLSSDNVVIKENVKVKSMLVKADGFEQNRYYKITDAKGNVYASGSDKKISNVILTSSNGYDIKTNEVGKVLTDGKTYTVKFIENYDDGSFVGVAFAPTVTPVEGEVTITVNARWKETGKPYKAAQLTGEIKDGAYVGQIVTVKADFTEWNKQVTSQIDKFGDASVYVIKDNKVTIDGKEVEGVVALDASIKDGILNVSFSKVAADAFDTTALVAGKYNVVLMNASTGTIVEISFIVK